jgi:MoxR-like ATPase
MQNTDAKTAQAENGQIELHPLEETVLSLATGTLYQLEQPAKPRLIVISKPDEVQEKTAEPETIETVSLEKFAALHRAINYSIDFVSKQILGREQIIRQAFFALMCGEHQLLISRTGMAKSMLARQIFACFDGALLFEKQLTKDTMPDNLFGAYDIEAMKRGKMIHNVEGSLVLSHFAFLDEIFDANDMLLRSLLSLLNEKKLVNGEQIIHSPLQTVIAAANYIRVTEILEAVLDRFLYKSYIPENKDLYFQFSIDNIYQKNFGTIQIPEKRIGLQDFNVVKELIKSRAIEIPGYILLLKNHILRQYIEETREQVPDKRNYTISDRTSAKAQDLLRASAILDGRPQASEADLDSLQYMICTLGRDEEKSRFTKISSAARRYFQQDREILENIFDGISIFGFIKTWRNAELLKSDATFNLLKARLEKLVKKESSGFREYLEKIKNKFITLPQHAIIPETFTVLEDVCDLSLKDARTREAREIIEGFRQDVFNAKKLTVQSTQ